MSDPPAPSELPADGSSPAPDRRPGGVRGRLLDAEEERFAPVLRAWATPDAIRAGLLAAIEPCFDRLTSVEIATERHASIGRGRPEDYLDRLLEVPGGIALAGIRFVNGDGRHPFVDLVATTGPEVDEAAAADIALTAFAAFTPRVVRRVAPSAVDGPEWPGWTTRLDQVMVAERVGAMVDAPPPPVLPRVDLVPADVDEACAAMDRAYAVFAIARPDLVGRVPPSDRDELVPCADEGHLHWWRDRGERAGLLAVQTSDWLGLRGHMVIEEFAIPGHEGSGLAAAAQRRLAERIAASDPDAVLHGTIDGDNLASRRTASRVGRREYAAWWYLVRDPG